jgi:hypothetical protein
LTRKPGDCPEGDYNNQQQYQFQTILAANRLYPDLIKLQLEDIASSDNCSYQVPQPVTIVPILAADTYNNNKEDNNNIPEMLEVYIKEAQANNKIY